MHRSMIAVALLMLAPLVSAQVYTWKDANGTMHYSQSPPPGNGTKFKQVKTDTSEPPAPTTSAATTAAPATPAPTAIADTPENRSKVCATLQANISALQGNGPVVAQQDGKQTLLDDAARKQQASAAQAQYQQECAK